MRAFVTGASGQDGSYLVESLLAEGAEVHALVRHGDVTAMPSEVVTHRGDLAVEGSAADALREARPNEVYHLGGVSSVAQSWREPGMTARVTGSAVAELLEASWQLQEETGEPVRFLLASSAEIFGAGDGTPRTEDSPVRPGNPYGAAKAFATHLAQVYRGRGLAASSAILFNHESPRRPDSFVTRKITAAAARIAAHGGGELALGNIDVARDWGWAPDYVRAMLLAQRHTGPGDYVVATGVAHTVKEFVAAAFGRVGLDWEDHVVIDPAFFRPNDAPALVGSPERARSELGWEPTVAFEEIVGAMVDADVALIGDAG